MTTASGHRGDVDERAHEDFRVHQEEDVVALRPLVATATVGVLVGAAGVFFAGLILAAQLGALRPTAAGPEGPRRAPRAIANIEQTPVLDARTGLDMRVRQARALERWGWIDRDGGVATIPIEQAIDIVVSEGVR